MGKRNRGWDNVDSVRRASEHNKTCGRRGEHIGEEEYTYTEADFHACLLVHGWRHDVKNPAHYWATVDLWFKDAWPERYIDEQPMMDHSGQMEFKLQFFDWVRNLKRATDVGYQSAHHNPEHAVHHHAELTQLCKKGYMGGEA